MVTWKNLNVNVMALSVDEFIADYNNSNLYVSNKLAPESIITYFKGLKEALFNGDVNTFTQYLIAHNCLTAKALKRNDAAEVLAYNEFKRYYIRGVCLQAEQEGKLLQVYRARTSKNPSKDAGSNIGEIIRPEDMLAVARIIPGTKTENNSRVEHRVLRPNSGLCVEILYKKETSIDNGGQING